MIELRLDLGILDLVIAAKTNLKLGPRFAEVWLASMFTFLISLASDRVALFSLRAIAVRIEL